ncbi:hypothetical protein DJ547_16510 [Enterobacter hormaechei]|nr:hypothetical protein DJ546_15465 [Enterobacter hormaechei]TYF52025.1 hypothetical protein DJ547_16510 [Enterobacter hormaechei]
MQVLTVILELNDRLIIPLNQCQGILEASIQQYTKRVFLEWVLVYGMVQKSYGLMKKLYVSVVMI